MTHLVFIFVYKVNFIDILPNIPPYKGSEFTKIESLKYVKLRNTFGIIASPVVRNGNSRIQQNIF